EKVLDYLGEMEKRGGIIEVIKTGWFQSEIARSAYNKLKEIDEGKRVVVGVNRFATDDGPKFQLHKADPRVAEEMKQRVKRLREERAGKAVEKALLNLKKAAEKKGNTIPYIREAVKAYATVGEICDVLREVLGEHQGLTI
ncbi:MAG: methylmalonyl-CoA mutase, partial [Deltaproteobacteria bacterium]|nr:methylmalonyl-CoA mutase [Deltaproteobacteria bacterium]